MLNISDKQGYSYGRESSCHAKRVFGACFEHEISRSRRFLVSYRPTMQTMPVIICFSVVLLFAYMNNCRRVFSEMPYLEFLAKNHTQADGAVLLEFPMN